MTIYTVHTPPVSKGDIDRHTRTRFVPDSKALLALVFPLVWLLWHRLWWPALFYALISITLTLSLTSELGVVIGLLTFVPGLYLFLEGNELRRKTLERRGWQQAGLVEGLDLAEAEIRYFNTLEENDIPQRPNNQKVVHNTAKTSYVVDSGIDFLATPEST